MNDAKWDAQSDAQSDAKIDAKSGAMSGARNGAVNGAVLATASLLDPGHRSVQEDFALCLPERGIFAVADGFGGPGPGAQASRAACEAIRDFLVREAGDLDATLPFVLRNYYSLAANVLFNSMIHANRQLNRINRGRTVHERGGASAIAGFLDGDLLAIANVGATGAWLLRAGESAELVIPRSYARLRDPAGSRGVGHLAAPLMALGVTEDLEPEIVEYRVRPKDWLILHTDGVSPDAIGALLALQSRGLPPIEAAERGAERIKSGCVTENAAAAIVIF